MNTELDKVKEFHDAFEIEGPKDVLPEELKANRASFMFEEVDEFMHAETLVEQVDACLDLIYFVLGNLELMGITEVDKLFDIVHKANMGKLWEDGPHYNHFGKVIKPEGWEGPEQELDNAIQEIRRSNQ